MLRASLVLLPTIPGYIISRWRPSDPQLSGIITKLPGLLEVASEINLAIFYIRGTYYDLLKRLLGIRHVSENHSSQPAFLVDNIAGSFRCLRETLTSGLHLIPCLVFC
jgi:peroxin-10